MYVIFTYIWLICMVNVGEYTIHGSYGVCQLAQNLERSSKLRRIPLILSQVRGDSTLGWLDINHDKWIDYEWSQWDMCVLVGKCGFGRICYELSVNVVAFVCRMILIFLFVVFGCEKITFPSDRYLLVYFPTFSIPSMYGIFTYIWLFLMVEYGKCR